MDTYQIIPLRIGQYENLEISSLTYMQNHGKKLRAPLIAYLVRGSGHTVLVDTGGSDEQWSSKYHTRIIRPAEETIFAQLESHGVSPAEVRYIINTHLHWDHCFNNDLFPWATAYAQRREIEYAKKPLPGHYLFYEAPALGFTPKWAVLAGQLHPVDDDTELFPGIKMISLPGHTPGFQGVLVQTEHGRCMIAGDTIGLFSNWEDPERQIVSGIYNNLEDCYRSLKRIAELSDYILPGHDPLVFEEV